MKNKTVEELGNAMTEPQFEENLALYRAFAIAIREHLKNHNKRAVARAMVIAADQEAIPLGEAIEWHAAQSSGPRA